MDERRKMFLNELAALFEKYGVDGVRVEYCEGANRIRFLSNLIDMAFAQYHDGQFSDGIIFVPTAVSPYFAEPVEKGNK